MAFKRSGVRLPLAPPPKRFQYSSKSEAAVWRLPISLVPGAKKMGRCLGGPSLGRKRPRRGVRTKYRETIVEMRGALLSRSQLFSLNYVHETGVRGRETTRPVPLRPLQNLTKTWSCGLARHQRGRVPGRLRNRSQNVAQLRIGLPFVPVFEGMVPLARSARSARRPCSYNPIAPTPACPLAHRHEARTARVWRMQD